MAEDTCWFDDVHSELLVDAGVAHLLGPETGSRYRDGDRVLLQPGSQTGSHISFSVEVVGDLALTSEAEAAPRTRVLVYDEGGALVASTGCSINFPYEPGGPEGLVLAHPTFVIVSDLYEDILVGHSATLVIETLDVYGQVASGQVSLAIHASEQ